MDHSLNTEDLKMKKERNSDSRIPNMLVHKEEEERRCCPVFSKEANNAHPRPPLMDEKSKGSCPVLIRPITPSPDRGSIPCNHDDILTPDASAAKTPPPCLSPPSSCSPPTSCVSLCPHTPREVVFDPFAPGPDHLVVAPMRCIPRSRRPRKEEFQDICRRLSFGGFNSSSSSDDDEDVLGDVSEEMIVECLYESLLDSIIRKEMEEEVVCVVDNDNISEPEPTSLQTPPCTILGVRDDSLFDNDSDSITCPGAPMKPAVRKARNIEGVRRRLEF